jgi:hypothetical protein
MSCLFSMPRWHLQNKPIDLTVGHPLQLLNDNFVKLVDAIIRIHLFDELPKRHLDFSATLSLLGFDGSDKILSLRRFCQVVFSEFLGHD